MKPFNGKGAIPGSPAPPKREKRVSVWVEGRKLHPVWMSLLLLITVSFISPPVHAIEPGGKAGLIITASGEVRGPLPYTLNSNLTGLVEPLPIIEDYAEHTIFAYYPYDVNTSPDPKRVSATPIRPVQTQDGESTTHLDKNSFYVAPPVTYYVGDNPGVQFAITNSNFFFHINSNASGVVVNSVTLESQDGAEIAFNVGYADITLPSNDPKFAVVSGLQDTRSSILLNINGGLPVPNSTTKFSRASMAFSPFNAYGDKLLVKVSTNKGDREFEIDGEEYKKGTSYVIPLYLEFLEPEVSLQWSVSTTTDDTASFTDVDNEKTTVANVPGPVYLQIRPDVKYLEYDSWDIDYTAVPVDYLYPVTVPIDKDDRYDFNEGNPHRAAGTYTYTVHEVRLYKGGSLAHLVSYDNTPYKHTIRINTEEPPPVDIYFQWSVSTTTGDDDAFSNVRNNTTTEVAEPTPVYLRIHPVVTGPLEFDSWEISYTAVPQEYEFPMTPVVAGSPYGFNNADPHTLPGSYTYTVHSYAFYKEGKKVLDSWGYYQHTIIIDRGDDPDPPDPPQPPDPPEPPVTPWPPVLPPDPPVIDPDPDPDQWIVIRQPSPLCYTDMELPILFMLQYKEKLLEYALAFTDEAKAAGFEDDSVFTALPDNGLITIPVKGYVPKGIYYGYVVVRIKGKAETELFPFRIQAMDYIRITEQPQPVSSRCEGDGFKLWVETEGDVLSYQWFRNGEIIPAAIDSVYEAILDDQTLGDYYVEVNGYCNTEISDTVTLGMNTLKIQIKWDDVLYLTNTDGQYVAFRWYKDGQAINPHGTSIYYTDPNGLLGSYHVRAYRDDGSYDETCPVSFVTTTKASEVSLYPNPVGRGTSFTLQGEELQGSSVEVYDFYGRQVSRKQVTGNMIDMIAPSVSGMYVVRIVQANGRVKSLKLLVKD